MYFKFSMYPFLFYLYLNAGCENKSSYIVFLTTLFVDGPLLSYEDVCYVSSKSSIVSALADEEDDRRCTVTYIVYKAMQIK